MKLAQYAERLIDQRFKGEEMKAFLELPIDQFLKLTQRAQGSQVVEQEQAALWLEPIRDDGTAEVRELNEYAREVFHFAAGPELEDHSA